MLFGFDQNVQWVFCLERYFFLEVLQSRESSTNPNTREAMKLALAGLVQW